jgi:hypothetical protein
MKLAAISGVNGVFSDEDIEHVRELALAARAKRRPARRKVAVERKVVPVKRAAPARAISLARKAAPKKKPASRRLAAVA